MRRPDVACHISVYKPEMKPRRVRRVESSRSSLFIFKDHNQDNATANTALFCASTAQGVVCLPVRLNRSGAGERGANTRIDDTHLSMQRPSLSTPAQRERRKDKDKASEAEFPRSKLFPERQRSTIKRKLAALVAQPTRVEGAWK
jgi:hypothetical protein